MVMMTIGHTMMIQECNIRDRKKVKRKMRKKMMEKMILMMRKSCWVIRMKSSLMKIEERRR